MQSQLLAQPALFPLTLQPHRCNWAGLRVGMLLVMVVVVMMGAVVMIHIIAVAGLHALMLMLMLFPCMQVPCRMVAVSPGGVLLSNWALGQGLWGVAVMLRLTVLVLVPHAVQLLQQPPDGHLGLMAVLASAAGGAGTLWVAVWPRLAASVHMHVRLSMLHGAVVVRVHVHLLLLLLFAQSKGRGRRRGCGRRGGCPARTAPSGGTQGGGESFAAYTIREPRRLPQRAGRAGVCPGVTPGTSEHRPGLQTEAELAPIRAWSPREGVQQVAVQLRLGVLQRAVARALWAGVHARAFGAKAEG